MLFANSVLRETSNIRKKNQFFKFLQIYLFSVPLNFVYNTNKISLRTGIVVQDIALLDRIRDVHH